MQSCGLRANAGGRHGWNLSRKRGVVFLVGDANMGINAGSLHPCAGLHEGHYSHRRAISDASSADLFEDGLLKRFKLPIVEIFADIRDAAVKYSLHICGTIVAVGGYGCHIAASHEKKVMKLNDLGCCNGGSCAVIIPDGMLCAFIEASSSDDGGSNALIYGALEDELVLIAAPMHNGSAEIDADARIAIICNTIGMIGTSSKGTKVMTDRIVRM